MEVASVELRRWGRREEVALAWWCGPGQSAFERSTMGAQLEAAAAASRTSDGHRSVPRRELEARSWAWRQRQIGRCAVGLPPTDDSPEPDAWPVAPRDQSGDGYTPDDRELTWYAQISRALGRISISHRAALVAYYSAPDRWESLHPMGRIVAVLPLTKAGRRLLDVRRLRRSAAAGKGQPEWDALTPAEQIAHEVAHPGDQGVARRAGEAGVEALELLEAARWSFAQVYRVDRDNPQGRWICWESPDA